MGGPTGGGSFAQPLTGADYNRRLQAGESSDAIRNSQKGLFGNGLSDNQFNDIVTQAGMQSPTGRPLAGSAQFYQPIYQPQYQNYNMGSPMGISQYGQQPSFGGGFGGFGGGFGRGFGGGFGRGFGGFSDMMYRPDMGQREQQMPGPTMMSGMGGTAENGFMSPGGMGGLSSQQQALIDDLGRMGGGQAGGYTPFAGFGPQQQYFPQQGQQMQQATPARTSSTPAQGIISRAAGVRNTPNMMRRAEGGIASLMDEA